MKYILLIITCILSIYWSAPLSLSAEQPTGVEPGVSASNKKIKFATLEWPPYLSKKMEHDGALSYALKKIMLKEGYEIEIEFIDWGVAMSDILNENGKYDAVIGAYYSAARSKSMFFTDGLIANNLVFASLSDISWDKLSDMSKYQIGIVSGYVYQDEFDGMVSNKELKVTFAKDDFDLLEKLIAKEVEVIAIEESILDYMLKMPGQFELYADVVKRANKILVNKEIHIVTRKNDSGGQLKDNINKAIKGGNVRGEYDKYFEKK